MVIKMAAADVHVVSKETVKPSHQTDPSNLKNVKLSLLDQIQPPIYVPVVFFYEAGAAGGFSGIKDPAKICRNLKESLSKTLAAYRPLAGRVDLQNFRIDCSDEGVEFVEARVHARLSDVLKGPNLINELQKHLPLDRINYVGEGPLFSAQVNFFDCGGVSVGVCMPHTVGDAATLIQFVREWSNVCREQKPPCVSLSDFYSAARFLPVTQDLSAWNLRHSLLLEEEPTSVLSKSYVFTKDKLISLKKMATNFSKTSCVSDIVENPSRVELVTAFIWNEFIDNNWDASKSFGAAETVNIRRRAGKSLQLENTFGNCYVLPAAIFTPPDEVKRLPQLQEQVSNLRKIIRGVNDEYTGKMGDEDGYLKYYSQLYAGVEMGKIEATMFSSWCRFPVYEVDFGWGQPVWVGTTIHTTIGSSNFLIDTKCGEGIEAFVNLNRHNVEAFEEHFNQL